MNATHIQNLERRLVANGLATLGCLIVAISAAAADPAGYFKSTVALEGPAVGLAFDADGVLYALEEAPFNSNQAILRAILPNGSIVGSFTITGNEPDNFFVGGMTYDPVGDRLLISDNTADGRMYAVSKSGVQQTIATGISAIAVPAVRGTGEIFVTTAVGNNTGEVLQVDRTTGATSVVLGGLDYGAGLAFDATGDLLVQDADFFTLRGRLQRVPITETLGGLVFGGPISLLADMSSSYGVAVDGEDDIFVSGRGGLYNFFESPPTESLFYSDGSADPISTAIAFDPGLQLFEPFAGSDGGRLAFNADFGHVKNDLFVTILTPTIPGDYDSSGEVSAVDYQFWKSAYGSSNLAADGNRDGVVDAADYTVWRNYLGTSLGYGGVAAASIVPEPNAAKLASLAFVIVLGWSARKRSNNSYFWRHCQWFANF